MCCRSLLMALALALPALAASALAQGDDGPRLVVDPPRVVAAERVPAVMLEPAFGGREFQRPVDAAQAPGDDRTWYVVEQRGLVWKLTPGIDADTWRASPWLDLQPRVARAGNEEGLLGLAFDPHFATEGHPRQGAFYVNYSVKPGPLSRLSRFVGGVESEEVLLEVPQPWRNHNGGGLAFGPDGYLYYSLGDGGAAGDPQNHGQRPQTLLGSILRLDVSATPAGGLTEGRPYGIPADNPALPGAPSASKMPSDSRPEVWAWGLRNAWRFSFDRATGECWAGDVGQDLYEYVYIVRAGGNHGWRLLEGFHSFRLPAGEPPPHDLVPPIFEYPHPAMAEREEAWRLGVDIGSGLSITGGFVYRGSELPELQGWYLFADYVMKTLWAIRRLPDGRVEHATLLRDAGTVASFAQGHDGELLILDHSGPVLHLRSPRPRRAPRP
ncbi:MAG: PQQ-dependent sugar dehydrogenase [Planctomycetota bacterium]